MKRVVRRSVIIVSLLGVAPRLAVAQPAASTEQAAPKLTKAPKLAQFVEAAYPESEKAQGRTASVVLQIAISATGTVDNAVVLESAGPTFDEAALAAVKQFIFEPAEIDNKPAAIRINYRYDFVLKAEVPTTALFEGIVNETATGKPLSGVNVALADGRSAITDEQGRFQFSDVSPGKLRVILTRSDLKAMQTEETFEAGQKVAVVYQVDLAPSEPVPGEEADDLEIVIIAPKLTKQVVSTKVEADQAKRVAGTQGDVLKVVENLPGVARTTAGGGQIVVWGAAPEDTRVYADGVRIPLLYHFGGLRSVIHSDMVKSVELVPGGYGAAYGRGLGGLITVDSRDPAAQHLGGSVQADLLDASIAGTGPIASRFTASAAARRSHLDWMLNRFTSRDVEEFFPLPQYYDAQARLRYSGSPTEWVELSGLLSNDRVSRQVWNSNPANRKSETKELYFDRLSLRYKNERKDGSGTVLVPWVGRDHAERESRFGSVPTSIDVKTMNYGLRANWYGKVEEYLVASVGLDLEATSSSLRRSGSISTPPREGDASIFGAPPSDQINSDDWRTVVGSAAPYVEADLALWGDKLHIVPGLRIEPLFVSVNRRVPAEGDDPEVGLYRADVSVEPRLSLRYALNEDVTLKAAYGRYHQPPLAEDLSSVFGNPQLEVAQATHWLAGGSVDLSKTLQVETTVFYSRSRDLAVRNPVSSPRVAQALVSEGGGRAMGAQLLLRRDLAQGFFGWIAYTLLRSERVDPRGQWRPFDFDQTHVLTALASYDLGAGFDVGARLRYATGYPRTPVIGAYFDARRGRYEPIMGEHNSVRIPAFVQLDLRLAKTWQISTSELEVYADVQNVTDRDNAEEIAYSSDFSQKRYIQGLPILSIVGARFSL
jgi:TonB family protein